VKGEAAKKPVKSAQLTSVEKAVVPLPVPVTTATPAEKPANQTPAAQKPYVDTLEWLFICCSYVDQLIYEKCVIELCGRHNWFLQF